MNILETLKILWTDLRGASDEHLTQLLQRLPAQRQARAEGYKLVEDRRRSIAAGALLQLAMDRAGIPVTARKTTKTEHGKPVLCGDWADRFHFSLSHSGDIVLCAFGVTPVGADVEQPGRALPKIVERKCPPGEWHWLQAQPDPAAAFFRLWVLKEAYVKAIGTGLTLGLDRYEIRFDEPIRVLRDGVIEPWQFYEHMLHGYPAAVCAAEALDCIWEEIDLQALL